MHGLVGCAQAHGVLSVFGWGILLPVGVIIKRYSRNITKNPEVWFMLHISFQISGYTVGVTAWAIGIALMSNSRHFNTFKGHRTIGIIIFCLATLQVSISIFLLLIYYSASDFVSCLPTDYGIVVEAKEKV